MTPNLYHFHNHTGQEMDVVVEWKEEGWVARLEVKVSCTLGLRDFSGLQALRSLTKERFLRGVVLYERKEIAAKERELLALPVEALWRLGGHPSVTIPCPWKAGSRHKRPSRFSSS